MQGLIHKIIDEFHERSLPSLTPREIEIPKIPGKVDVVIGMRRSGKTWFLFQLMQELIKDGISKESILYVNFEDERLLPLMAQGLSEICEAFYMKNPDLRDQSCHLFFDEIQDIPNWEKFIRRVLDTENVHLYITGSSSKLLSREIATTLRGRSISSEIFPFSFRESLAHEGMDPNSMKRPGAANRSKLQNRLQKYLKTGGFPEVLDLEEHYRVRILQEYVDVVILRDIIERYQVRNISPLRYMVRHLLNSPGCLFSVNKYFRDLKSMGVECGKNTLYDFLRYLEDAFLLFPVEIYTRSDRVRRVHPRKIYLVDPGLATAFSRSTQSRHGQLLENFVYLELRRRQHQIFFYRTATGKEVDFFITDNKREESLVQVCLQMKDPKTRKREVGALAEAMVECNLKTGTIITLDEHDKIESENGAISVIAAWSWALQQQQINRSSTVSY